MYGPGPFLYVIFLMIGWILIIYTLNFYFLAYQSRNNVRHTKKMRQRVELPAVLPIVTVQLPLYNEKYVAKRLIDAVCRMDYPRDRLHIQVLDDSDDDTFNLIKSIVDDYRFKGFDIMHLHRTDRSGYKAGALKAGMKHAKGEFVAIFDADFIPPVWFLKKSVAHFCTDLRIGLVQCKWGHANENYSTLTEAQAVSLDLHFLIEQKAKSMSHLYMNFNGTAGMWRTSCINDAGGWHTSTLVEDLDLSYRAQMKGWKCLYLEGVEVDAELPVQMNAAKRQQFRWAKGGIQVALKLMSDILVNRRVPVDTKAQAFIQLTRHVVNPLVLAQFLIFPMLLAMDYKLYTVGWAPLISLIMFVMMGPGGYLLVINQAWNGDPKKLREKARQFFFLMFFASGISVNNTVAVFDAVFGKKNEFLRTPKFGVVNKGDDWRHKEYVLPFTKTTLLEIFFAIYGCVAVFIALSSGNAVYAPMLAIPTIGFIYVAYLSTVHSSFVRKKVKPQARSAYAPSIVTSSHMPSGTTMTASVTKSRTVSQRTVLVGVIAFLMMGAGIAYYGYQTTMYPINQAIGYVARAQTAQTPEQLAEYVELTVDLIPARGNPVWLFSTARTDFEHIQTNLDGMIKRAESTSAMVTHGEQYNIAMRDMHQSADVIKLSLLEAVPYMYISLNNVIMAGVWVGAIIVIFAAMRKARARLEYKTI
jgi:cellulose synthase/poly-beta-1,6-N-acetylglucosamine synthase-like glycosyltransferase